jgi:hypothetical protein
MLTKDDYHYGAVEAAAKSLYEGNRLTIPYGETSPPWDATPEPARAMMREGIADVIRAIESAGYKVVGPEPTEAMIHDGGSALIYPSVYMGGVPEQAKKNALRVIRSAIAAIPTLTEPKP